MQDISWKWVGIGAAIIIALNQTAGLLLATPLAVPLVDSMGLLWGMLIYTLIVAFLSYFVGGVIVGRLSPGVTCKEPGVASLVAVGLNLIISMVLIGRFPGLLGIAIAAGLGYGLGYLGGLLGEAWQGHPPSPSNPDSPLST